MAYADLNLKYTFDNNMYLIEAEFKLTWALPDVSSRYLGKSTS